jgi:hypothetical protein
VLTVVTSGKSAPGATTATWALALAWPRPVLAVDADPAGGDMTAGFLPGRVSVDRGLLSWSAAARRGTPAMTAATLLATHATTLADWPRVWLLPGFTAATQAHSLTGELWERLSRALARCTPAIGRDAVVDAGRLVDDGVMLPILRAADRVLVAVRPSVRSVHSAQQATARIAAALGDLESVQAWVVGRGPYGEREVAAAVGLPLAGALPDDRASAEVLTDGAAATVRGLSRSPLLRAAAALAQRLSVMQRPERLVADQTPSAAVPGRS